MTTLDPQEPASAGTQGANIMGTGVGDGPGPDVMAASTLGSNKVISADGEHVGKISDIMLDVRAGRVAYAVLSSGGFLGMGDTLHAIPWAALTLDTDEKCFVLDALAERIKNAPGFDKDHCPPWRTRNGAPRYTSITTGRRTGMQRATSWKIADWIRTFDPRARRVSG